jgi:bifunctional DNA-binding transcriptional regulator/antitoxin component of YhaV-PrlF toxin-antitoxin module
MPKIPVYNQQIEPVTANISQPDVLQRPPEQAFGGDVARAKATLATDVLNPLAQRFKEKADFENQQYADGIENRMLNDINDQLYSQDEISVNRNGQKVTIPKGILNRHGINAKDSIHDFNEWQRLNIPKYIEAIRDPELKRKFALKAHDYLQSTSNDIIRHEVKQDQIYKQDSADSFIKTKAQMAASAKTPEDLQKIINDISGSREGIDRYLGKPEDTIKLNKQADVKTAVENNVNSLIIADPTGVLAQKRLEEFKDQMNPKDYTSLKKGLGNTLKEITKSNQLSAVQAQIGNEVNYLTNYANGKNSWMTVSDISRDVRENKISSDFGLALIDVIQSGGSFEPTKQGNENYPTFINGIYNAKDQVELQNTLTKLLQDHKNISQEKMSVLINEAMKRGQALPTAISMQGNKQIDPKQQEIDAGAMAVTNFGRRSGMSNNEIADLYQNYVNLLNKNKSVKEAYQEAININAKNQYPPSATFETPPNMILDENSPIRVIFPRGSKNGSSGSNKNVSK